MGWLHWFADQHPLWFIFISLVIEAIGAWGLARAWIEDFEI